MNYTTITSEGGLLPADLLETIAAGELTGQRAEDFGLPKNRRLTDEIAAAWGDARAFWSSLERSTRRLRDDDPATSQTREQWMLPLLHTLGYDSLTFMPSAARANNRTYAISHRAADHELGLPIHIEGRTTSLDQRPPSGRPRLSPHALMQEYLNTTEHVWGIVANGATIRLLRDWAQVSRPRYVEFDLKSMLEGEKFSEFALMYRILHRSRFPQTPEETADSLIERYHQQALEQGGRVRDGLREGVEQALEVLGNGLVQHPANQVLRERITSGSLTPIDFYRQLLRLVYRLLFLMVAEERHLIAVSPDETDQANPLHYRASHVERLQVYMQHYSVSRLRRMVEHPGTGRAAFDDMWMGLQTTFRLLEGSDEHGAQLLGLAPLNGDLFGEYAIRDLIHTKVANQDLLTAIRALSLYRDPDSRIRRRVNYAALDVEELGSVYESLLDYRPVLSPSHQSLRFTLVAGTERKTTGSYYTRPELVHELIKSALDPVIEQRLRSFDSPTKQERALLSITVCDPACGSGHFLLAAARRIGRELAKVRSGEDQPTPKAYRLALRDVIAHCIYGVDYNPLAVDLCKLALWIEGHSAGLPLSFLDHHIKHGNSLVGATQELIEQGVPDDAFKPVTGDDKQIAGMLKKRNKQERETWEKSQVVQGSLFDTPQPTHDTGLLQGQRELERLPDSNVQAVRTKAERYQALQQQAASRYALFDLWTAAFFVPLTADNANYVPTTKTIIDARHQRPLDPQVYALAQAQATELHFFHWELVFPLVFDQDGFDVVLGNPPWERIKLQEQEFFAAYPEIIAAPNKAARQKLINKLPQTNPALAQAFEHAKHGAEATSGFVRYSGRYSLTAVGDINTYALFSELDRSLIKSKGRAGIIVPTGIATDDTTKAFFGDLNAQNDLVSLYDFENREKLFADVDSRMRFVLMTIGQTDQPTEYTFFATNTQHLEDEQRRFTLTAAEIGLLNPNTRTCPVFRTKTDAELTKKIYRRAPVLENETSGVSPWGISFMRMFDMSNDSNLFQTQPAEGLVPLYEAKMMHQYTHRWATYLPDGKTADASLEDLQNPEYEITPRYWIEQSHVEQRLEGRWDKQWLLGFRDVARSTDQRTAIFSLIPRLGVGHKAPLMFVQQTSLVTSCFITVMNSVVLDFVTRQKIGGTSLSFFIVKQLPVLPPESFSADDIAFISERVLELVYTAWDMQPFAEDLWHAADGELQAAFTARNRECNATADPELFRPRGDFSLPPFRWNEERRAQIRAELDARIARLYGLTRDELRYILDPEDVYGPEFPGETFRVLKNNDLKEYGEYRTQRLVLAAWDANEAHKEQP